MLYLSSTYREKQPMSKTKSNADINRGSALRNTKY